MQEPDHGPGRPPDDAERLRRLSQRLTDLRRETDPDTPRAPDHHSQAQMAWRMVTELVAGLLVGFGIGLGLDALFGTRPWLLVLFTLLGFAAGVRTMIRTAREVETRGSGARTAPQQTPPVRPAAGPRADAIKPAGPTPAPTEQPASDAGAGQEEGRRRG